MYNMSTGIICPATYLFLCVSHQLFRLTIHDSKFSYTGINTFYPFLCLKIFILIYIQTFIKFNLIENVGQEKNKQQKNQHDIILPTENDEKKKKTENMPTCHALLHPKIKTRPLRTNYTVSYFAQMLSIHVSFDVTKK